VALSGHQVFIRLAIKIYRRTQKELN